MCGIVGIFNFDGEPVSAPLLAHMAEAIAHRGPDDEGSYVQGNVGLFHKRLSIIDLSSGHQPMVDGPLAVVFNGEIYNYIELREELRARGHEFRTSSDTEVLLRGYAEWGEQLVVRLNGMFAFVLVDQARKRALIARDHFGIKPLYLHRTANRLLFASEIKALLRHPAVAPRANDASLRDYLTFQFVLGEGTLFDGVTRLMPGHYATVDLATGAMVTKQYWEPSFVLDPYHTEEYFIVELQRLLHDAIRLQVRSDVPVGSYLSGGMDSSIVTMMAAPHFGPGLRTFTGAFREGPEFDETDYARAVGTACHAKMHVVRPTEQEFVELLPKMIWHMDEPVAGPGLFPQFMVARAAASQVKVVLGGQGGDEIFGGYTRYMVAYLEQALKGAIFENNEEAEHIVSLKSIVPNLATLQQYAPMLQQFWKSGTFESMDRRYFRLVDRSGGALGMYSADFRRTYDEQAQFERFQRVFNHPDTKSYYNKMTHFDMVSSLPALLHVEDRASMAASLESRVPLLDYRITDLIASMPPKMKFKGGELKYVLKRAVKQLLPARIHQRKDKMGFPVPLHLWARGRSREFFSDILTSQACRERGIFEPAEINRLLDEEHAFGRRLWGVLNLELWFTQLVDRHDAKAPSTSSLAPTLSTSQTHAALAR